MKALIVLVCILGLGAVIGAVVVGTGVFEGTVVDHPYEHGIAWDRDLARRRASGIEVRLRERRFVTGAATAVFTLAGTPAVPVGDRDVSVRVRRPESAAHDRTFIARRLPDGSWAAPVSFPLEGRWELVVLVERSDGVIEFPEAVVVVAEGEAACDLDRGPCSLPLPGGAGTVTLEVAPRPVRTMRELELSVALACAASPCAPESASVSFTMPGMYMGENSVRLEPAGEGRWRGRGVIVRCPSGRRLWRATVRVPPLGEVDFDLDTDRP